MTKYLVIALFISAITVSCKKDTIQKINEEEIDKPTQEFHDLTVIQTEKGELKFEIKAELVQGYQFADTPYYEFPKGIDMMSFTSDSVMESDFVADSAIFYQKPRSFVGKGNVVARNILKNMRLETDGPLYWTEATKEVYTNAPSIVIRPPDTIPAKEGLTADDEFKHYELRKGRDGVTYVDFSSKDTTQNNNTP